MNEKQDTYFGKSLTDAECDALALERFSPKLFDGESELQQRAWFDYRYLHPVKRTYHFASDYMNSYQALYRKYINIDAEGIYGLSRPNDPLDNRPPPNKTAKLRTPTCLWRARQVADGLRIPYDFYTRVALNYLFEERFYKAVLSLNANQKLRLNIQASALYSEAVIEHVLSKWEEYAKARITWSDNPRLAFTEEEMNGKAKPNLYKLDYEKHILRQIYPRPHRIFSIETAITRRALRPVVAAKIFSSEYQLTG